MFAALLGWMVQGDGVIALSGFVFLLFIFKQSHEGTKLVG